MVNIITARMFVLRVIKNTLVFFVCFLLFLRAFREQYLQGLVRLLDLDDSVMPVMGAFLSGLGFEGCDTFLSILQADPVLVAGATPIIQVADAWENVLQSSLSVVN